MRIVNLLARLSGAGDAAILLCFGPDIFSLHTGIP